jgi:broad specificity phosphatase PhoE
MTTPAATFIAAICGRRLLALLLACAPLTGWAAPTQIYFLRHADTARDARGQYIEAFTAKGETQVAALADKLAGLRFEAVIVSPQWRARQTIQPWLAAQGMTAEIWPELDESSWQRTATAVVPAAGDLIRIDAAAPFRLRAAAHGSLAGFDRDRQLHAPSAAAGQAMARFAADLIRQRWNGQGVKVLVVGHYHSGARLLERLQGGTAADYDPAQSRYRTGNTGLHVLSETCGGNFVLTRYDDGAVYAGKPLPEASPDYAGPCR